MLLGVGTGCQWLVFTALNENDPDRVSTHLVLQIEWEKIIINNRIDFPTRGSWVNH